MPNFLPSQSVAALKGDLNGSNEQSYITPSSMGGTGEVQTITAPATAAAAQGDYFVLENMGGAKAAIWLDIDANGTAPTGAAYVAADSKIEVNIVTGGTAAQNATLIQSAAASILGWTAVDNLDGTVTYTSSYVGNSPAPTRHNTGDTGDGSFVVATTTAGTAPTVQGKYFTYSSGATSFYGWFTSSGNGADPAVAAHTSKVIALDGDETNAEYLAAITAVIDGTTGMSAELDGSRIIVSVDAIGAATDLTAGDSGFTVEVRSPGLGQVYSPAINMADDNPQPSAIS